ncbi:MAG: hypothetical protein ABFS02_03070 [Pseudomonadota bacterium]
MTDISGLTVSARQTPDAGVSVRRKTLRLLRRTGLVKSLALYALIVESTNAAGAGRARDQDTTGIPDYQGLCPNHHGYRSLSNQAGCFVSKKHIPSKTAAFALKVEKAQHNRF